MLADKEQKTIANCVANDITTKFDKLSSQPKHCNFEVYDRLKRVNEEAYKPKTICIGPYYRYKRYQNTTLKSMEEHKLRYLENLVQRTNVNVLTYAKTMQSLEGSARNCYAEPIDWLHSNEFVEMMLLDSCFIVEFLRKNNNAFLRDEKDPIFRMDHIWTGIIMDLFLLENQLPFFVLDKVFEMTKINLEDSIIKMAYIAFKDLLPSIELSSDAIHGIRKDEIKHLLDLVHYCSCFPNEKKSSEGNVQDATRCMDSAVTFLIEQVPSDCYFPVAETSSSHAPAADEIPSANRRTKNRHIKAATELQEFGIKFEKSSSKLLDISFENGTIRIPHLPVHDGTESILRNLVAYEQCLPNNSSRPKYFTDYVMFMDDLVNSSKDVETLRHRAIIENALGEDKVVSKIFNKLCLEINESAKFHYSNICSKVDDHCSRQHNRWMASLRRNYCSSPWAFISFLAATLLLLLTVAQTVFSVLSVTESD